jgi:ABC-type Fe3+-siderophore transport system permease subunit
LVHRVLVRGIVPAGVVLALVVVASLLFGAGEVGPDRALAVLTGGGDQDARFAVLELRVPRTLVAVAVGLALGVAGAVLQTAARNPLAEPGLLGVSAGASFAVVLVIASGASAASLGPWVAVLGAAAGCALAVGAARLRGAGDDPVRLVLAGAALSSLLSAATSMLLLLDQRTSDEVRFWTVGSVAGRDLGTLAQVGPVLGAGVLLAVLAARCRPWRWATASHAAWATARHVLASSRWPRSPCWSGARSPPRDPSPSWGSSSPSSPAASSGPTCGGCSPSRCWSDPPWWSPPT